MHQDNNTKVYKVYTPTHYKSILRDEMENNIIISLHVFLLFIYLIWSLSSCATLICKIIDAVQSSSWRYWYNNVPFCCLFSAMDLTQNTPDQIPALL